MAHQETDGHQATQVAPTPADDAGAGREVAYAFATFGVVLLFLLVMLVVS